MDFFVVLETAHSTLWHLCAADWREATTISKSYEMLGRFLGPFKEQLDPGFDQKRIERLEAGRKRAAGLLPKEKEENPIPALDSLKVDDEPKPN